MPVDFVYNGESVNEELTRSYQLGDDSKELMNDSLDQDPQKTERVVAFSPKDNLSLGEKIKTEDHKTPEN